VQCSGYKFTRGNLILPQETNSGNSITPSEASF
jgi:hypothetical protein